MLTLDAFHLPGLPAPSTTLWTLGRGEDEVHLRVARLSPAQLQRQADALLAARESHLADRPVRQIARAIDRVALRFSDAGDDLHRAAISALPHVTGYSTAMVRHVLERMSADWRMDRIRALLRAEIHDPRFLDEFRPRTDAHGRTRAFGARLVTQVFSGNVPGVAVTSLVRALLTKAATLGKTAVGEPVLPALFARGLSEVDPDLGACLAVTYWRGGDEGLERVALREADLVVVYGGAEALAAVRAATPPGTRVLAYGPKMSFCVVAREALEGAAALNAARSAAVDASTFDQQGCVSPHLVYVEEGGAVEPRTWARTLADAMCEVERTLPRGTLSPSESSAIRQLRGESEFAQISGGEIELHASEPGTAWTVLYDPDPAFTASCLNRLVRVKPIESLDRVADLVSPYGPMLQSVGVAAPDERATRLAGALGALGASRICPLGSMAWPPPTWHHDGHPPLREMLRWCDLED